MTDTAAHGITWDLTDLYAGIDDPTIETDLKRLAERARAFEKAHRGAISNGPPKAADLAAMLRELERQLTTWLAQLGLNPADRGRLGLALVQAKATGLAALREERALKAGRRAG